MEPPQSIELIRQRFQQVIVRIATPYSNGTGFYLYEHNLIVTSEYAVRDNCEVIVEGSSFDRQMVPVVFTDTDHDIAFLRPKERVEVPVIHLAQSNAVQQGDWVMAIGHPFGLPFIAREGIVKKADYSFAEQTFIEVDAQLKPGNVGGPVINRQGEVIGVNTFLVRKEDQIDFALPVAKLQELITAYEAAGSTQGMRCEHCEELVFAPLQKAGRCDACKKKLTLPLDLPIYEPVGISHTIEELLTNAGHHAALTRRGPNTWEIREGSALVSISYYEKNGLIIGDAYLCELPPIDEQSLLEYLLKQNHEVEGLTFSIKNQTVVLSLLIYDRYFNADTGSKLFRHLFEKADYHDNILVERYGARWRVEEKDKM